MERKKTEIEIEWSLKEIEKKLKKIRKINNWIHVDEGLPPVDEKVIVWNSKWVDQNQIRIGYYDPSSRTKTWWRCEEFMDLEVTHWMFLPEIPEQG